MLRGLSGSKSCLRRTYVLAADNRPVPEVLYKLKGRLWLHGGPASWYFLTLPKGAAREIRLMLGAGVTGRGWGSIRVRATVGGTTWSTSIFPDKKAGSYLLPVKAEVRTAEGLAEGAAVAYTLLVDA
jgi:hypothetical protein